MNGDEVNMGKIELRGLNNTRDLGGIPAAYGKKIRCNRLIRSDALRDISKGDMEILKSHGLNTVVDFRTEQEVMESPDAVGEDISYVRIPVLENLRAGISREKESDKNLIDQIVELMPSKKSVVDYMRGLYRELAESPYSQAKYREFFRQLMNHAQGAVLYHCTAGKDRVGFATMLILECLGADRDVIIRDYMLTGEYLKQSEEEMLESIPEEIKSEELSVALHAAMGTREEYMESAYAYIEDSFGSVENYLSKALGMDAAARERMREMYLTD